MREIQSLSPSVVGRTLSVLLILGTDFKQTTRHADGGRDAAQPPELIHPP